MGSRRKRKDGKRKREDKKSLAAEKSARGILLKFVRNPELKKKNRKKEKASGKLRP